MEALRLKYMPEAKGRVTVVAADNENGHKKLTNKKGQISVVNPDLCIGCGVCAIKCPSKSLVLERLEVTYEPPKDAREMMKMILMDFEAAKVPNGQKADN